MQNNHYATIMQAKVMNATSLTQHLNIWRMKDEQIVFTNGCFDILHEGHLSIISSAKSLGGKLIIGLNSDASIKMLKGETRPINKEHSRALMLAYMQLVDAVILFEEETPINLIEMIKPDILVKGGDYKVAEIVGADFVIKHGGRVEIVPTLEGHSSTQIINRMKS